MSAAAEPLAQADRSAVQSMTGFATSEGVADGVAWQLDVRSVNARALDVRVRLPAGLDRHEPQIRAAVAKAFRRGTVSVTLTVKRDEGATRYSVNHEQLAQYLLAIADLAESGSVAAPRGDGLLSLKGVIEVASADEADVVGPLLEAAVTDALAALEADRRAEGGRIAPLVDEQLSGMEALRAAIDAHPERTVDAVRDRLARTIGELLEERSLPEDRLAQEAALLATRADVREELDRLSAHIASARQLIAEGGPVGRKLDFLAQELNREANTICAKAPHHAITQLGLELKVLVEQMREQVQNLE